LLGVPRSADLRQINKAFKRSALKNHPDKGGNDEMMKLINNAYKVLSTSDLRQQYDMKEENDDVHPFNNEFTILLGCGEKLLDAMRTLVEQWKKDYDKIILAKNIKQEDLNMTNRLKQNNSTYTYYK
jgi:curved DNA-binding protein CbpA